MGIFFPFLYIRFTCPCFQFSILSPLISGEQDGPEATSPSSPAFSLLWEEWVLELDWKPSFPVQLLCCQRQRKKMYLLPWRSHCQSEDQTVWAGWFFHLFFRFGLCQCAACGILGLGFSPCLRTWPWECGALPAGPPGNSPWIVSS